MGRLGRLVLYVERVRVLGGDRLIGVHNHTSVSPMGLSSHRCDRPNRPNPWFSPKISLFLWADSSAEGLFSATEPAHGFGPIALSPSSWPAGAPLQGAAAGSVSSTG